MTRDDHHEIAKAAVKETFFVLGVDVDDPRQVEAFRRDLRFAGDLRRYTTRGIGALVVAIVGAAVAAVWAQFWPK